MEQQSNNNLDALFQRAAKDYPLKTNNNNWDIVADQLYKNSAGTIKKSRKWQYALLLILLFTSGLLLLNNLNKKQQAYSINKPVLTPEKNSSKINQQTIEAGKSTDKNKTNDPIIKIQPLAGNASKKGNLIKLNKTISNNIHTFSNTSQHAEENKTISNSDNNVNIQQVNPLQQYLPAVTNQTNDINKAEQQKDSNDETFADKKVNQGSNQLNTKSGKENVHLKLRPQPNTFYGTLFISPDFSTVKFQHINKPGYSIGVALGYRINNRLSAEIGLQRIHNNFYSDGKYLDKSNLKLKPSAIINAVNGSSKLTEVPVSIRYNILKHSNHFFATAGTTVALITHTENYNYNITKNGSPDNISRRFNSLTGTKYFSTVNVGLGYEVPVVGKFKLMAEPYYQAPIRGLGIGKLPVSNFGLNIGIVKDLK